MSDPYYSLYCKQRELESLWQLPWACGFASLVTCFRILGDRTTENAELVARFRGFGGRPHDGMTTDEAVELGRAFGYRAVRNPSSTRRREDGFVEWMRKQWADGHPVMLSVDSHNEQGVANHWWLVYGDPGESNVWVMDPIEDDEPFELLSLAEVVEFASCDDGKGYIEYDCLAVSAASGAEMTGIPPSAELLNFLNENLQHDTGWTSQELAAALVDNHFSSVEGVDSQGHANGTDTVAVSDLLEHDGLVSSVIGGWNVFFSDEQGENIESLRSVLYDVEAHKVHKIAASEADHMTREIALNLILIGTNLLDG